MNFARRFKDETLSIANVERALDWLFELMGGEPFDLLLLYHHAFGHQIHALDSLNRISTRNSKRAALYITNSGGNRYIPYLFGMLKIAVVEVPQNIPILVMYRYVEYLRLHLGRGRIDSIYDVHSFYDSLLKHSSLNSNYMIGDNASGKLRYRPQTPCEILVQASIGPAPRLPDYLQERAREIIQKTFAFNPDEGRRLAYFHTRKKTSSEASCSRRSVADYLSYAPAIKEVVDRGDILVLGGDCPDSIAEPFGIDNYSIMRIMSKGERNLVNLYLLTSASYAMTHQSGPTYLASSSGVPQFVSNSFPLCLGTLGLLDVCLYKNIEYNGRVISWSQIANRENGYRKQHFGIHGKEERIMENSKEMLLQALRLFLGQLDSGARDIDLFRQKVLMLASLQDGSPIELHNSFPANLAVESHLD